MTGLLRKKEMVTIITPIPSFIPRQLAIDILHSHSEVITLNPLVLDHKPIKAPRDAASDEYYSTWYEIIERIQYVPGMGKMGSGKISFNACFHDMPWGLQAHIYAPMNTDMRYKYRIDGNQPGVEPPTPLEMGLAGLGAPSDGLYLREDVEVKCSLGFMSFIKSQLKAASKLMVQRIIKKAELVDSGVLHTMIENGRLKTVNPADRSTAQNLTVSPTNSPSPAVPSPGEQNPQKHSPQLVQPGGAPTASPASPTTATPYQVPRPQSISVSSPYALGARPASASVVPTYASPTAPGAGYPGYPAYPAYGYPMHPGHVSYSGHPGFSPPQMHPAMYAQYVQPPQPELYGYPVAVPASATAAAPPPAVMEMPGDYYHASTLAPPQGPPPPSSVNSTPRSNRDSDSLSTGQWSAPTDYTHNSMRGSPALSGSRPGSTTSETSASGGGGGGGFRSPGLDKGFSSDLATHPETLEEHRNEALKKLDPSAAVPPQRTAYMYNPADYAR